MKDDLISPDDIQVLDSNTEFELEKLTGSAEGVYRVTVPNLPPVIAKTLSSFAHILSNPLPAEDRDPETEAEIMFNSKRVSDYINHQRTLKQAGIPTLELKAGHEGSGVVYMPDMNWAELFFIDKEVFFLFSDAGGNEEEKKEYVEKHKVFFQSFLNIDLEVIHLEAHRIANLATVNNIRLPIDDPLSLIIDKQGRWQVVVVDLTGTKVDESSEKVEMWNQESVDWFRESLRIFIGRLKQYFKA